MAGFENYQQEIRRIEDEIEHMGVALGIDWSDEAQVRALAREALDHSQDRIHEAAAHPDDHRLGAKVTLFGLASLMLRTMEESAGVGIESHGGPVWKAFGRALWLEAEQRRQPEA
ncbi:MAG TPA: hypothetical protein PKY43_14660 [Thauera aminoaromatica]|jgi:hypothetical protein|nr:hypothetical protein [Thauera aminoaromatica]